MKEILRKNRPSSLLLVAIILLAAVLRLYNFPYRYALGEETVRDAVIGIEGARELQAPLIGSFSSLGPFTFGPLYAYQLTIATLFFRSLYAPWIYLTIISILYIAFMYKIGQQLDSKPLGLLLAFFASVSPAQIISATHLTSHNVTNVFAVLAIWIFLVLLKGKKSHWWSFFLGVSIGTGMNLHYQMAGLLILLILLLINKPKNYLHFVASLAGVFVTFIPLLFFELNNHWFNIRNMIDYMRFGRTRIYVPNRWLFYVRDFWPGFWADAFGIPILMSKVIIVVFLITTGLGIVRKKLSRPYLLLLVACFVNFVLLRYYWGQRFYGYLNFLRPFVFIFTGYTFLVVAKRPLGKFIVGATIILVLIFAAPRIIDELAPDAFSIDMYHQMALTEQKLAGQHYMLYGCTKVYHMAYNAKTFTIVFISELHKKSESPPTSLALKSLDCMLPLENLETRENQIYPVLNDIGLVDVTKSSPDELKRAGWERVTFRSIYDGSTRWWFTEKP